MRKYLLSALFLCTTIVAIQAQVNVKAQDNTGDRDSQALKVKSELINPSDLINDGQISLEVTGGTPPYTYKWSNQQTSLSSNVASKLTEGIDYTVIITDSEQHTVTKSYRIPAVSITENFNGAFTPIVDNMGAILFWDPFTAIGVYDPIVYADEKNVSIPGWENGIEDKFTLKSWNAAEGSHVAKGDLIAVISSEKDGDIQVNSTTSGKLQHLVEEGESIFDYTNTEDLIETGAHFFARIQYDEPVILTHPNGDPQSHNIPFIVVWLVVGAAFFTIRMGFINFRGFGHALELAKGKYDDPDAPGRITHFQALSTAVSATVGLGNIAGVAVAISLGGAGATFWMVLAGFLGMSSKFVECTLVSFCLLP